MNQETILVFAMLIGIGVLVVTLVRYQRNKEKRLASLAVIEIPIFSTFRTLVVLTVSSLPGLALLALLLDPWARDHAALALGLTVLVGAGGAGLGIRFSRRFRRVGLLRFSSPLLELEQGAHRQFIDLTVPFTLEEGGAEGPAHMPLQVLVVRQPGREVALAYGLPLGRSPYGDTRHATFPRPLLDGETRVIHDRLRAKAGR
jgi:hypothetical protein